MGYLDYIVGYVAAIGTLAGAMGCGDLPARPTIAVCLVTIAAWAYLLAV